MFRTDLCCFLDGLWTRCRRRDASDMKDLVHMMTQTLRLDEGVNGADGGRLDSTSLPEFRLNRRYRDTLLLHGKTGEEEEEDNAAGAPAGGRLWAGSVMGSSEPL